MNVVNGGLEHAQSNAASVMCEFGGKFVLSLIGESLFTFFASLAYVLLFLLELQNRLF